MFLVGWGLFWFHGSFYEYVTYIEPNVHQRWVKNNCNVLIPYAIRVQLNAAQNAASDQGQLCMYTRISEFLLEINKNKKYHQTPLNMGKHTSS